MALIFILFLCTFSSTNGQFFDMWDMDMPDPSDAFIFQRFQQMLQPFNPPAATRQNPVTTPLRTQQRSRIIFSGNSLGRQVSPRLQPVQNFNNFRLANSRRRQVSSGFQNTQNFNPRRTTNSFRTSSFARRNSNQRSTIFTPRATRNRFTTRRPSPQINRVVQNVNDLGFERRFASGFQGRNQFFQPINRFLPQPWMFSDFDTPDTPDSSDFGMNFW